MPPHIYLLSSYANSLNLIETRGARDHVSLVRFFDNSVRIELSETNSLVEDKYSMNIHTGSYTLEGMNETREGMIHHHPVGHEEKHLQFRLQSGNKVIRVMLPLLDRVDYERCIKGFIYITKQIIEYEQAEFGIEVDLRGYFFNERIDELCVEKTFLLQKIKQAQGEGNLLDDTNSALTLAELRALGSEPHLLPFLDF